MRTVPTRGRRAPRRAGNPAPRSKVKVPSRYSGHIRWTADAGITMHRTRADAIEGRATTDVQTVQLVRFVKAS